MTTEEKLKNYILERYRSIREFTIAIDMPYSTLKGVLTRGIDNSSVGVIFKICKALNISPDALAEGEIVPRIEAGRLKVSANIEKPTSEIRVMDVGDIIKNTKKHLLKQKNLSLNGKPVNKTEIATLINGIDISLEMVKKSQK